MKFSKSVLSILIVISLTGILASAEECETVSTETESNIDSDPSSVTSFKWLVAFRQISTNKFFCAGSLVSDKHVISTAKCFEKILPHDVVAFVGKHDLTVDNENGSVAHEVREILKHEDWKTSAYDFDADLSLIVLESEVDLQSDIVRTVCLPAESENEVIGEGVMPRRGINDVALVKNDSNPKALRLPVVARSQCLAADEGFVSVLSNRMFCAGFVNENNSACQGDKGGGFVQFDKTTKSYVLTGIYSSSLVDRLRGECRVDTYSMFTSVGKFVDWIETKMSETNQNRWIDVDLWCWETEVAHNCNHEYTGPFARNVKLSRTYTKANCVEDLWMDFKPSPYIFQKIGKNFPILKKLHIDSQSIIFIEQRNFENMGHLKELSLAGNEIEFIPEDSFYDLLNLENLYLEENKIKKIPEKIFSNLKNLEWIDISGNKILTVPRDLFAGNLKLKKIYTYNNPGLTTNNVDFSRIPDVELRNETDYEYYKGGDRFDQDGIKIQ